MEAISPIPAIFALLIAFITSLLITKGFGEPPSQGRFTSIDGLRGYLAFFVFLHHSCIWYYYLRTGKWEVPPSNLYVHFGQGSVSLFFMITGFLFFSKLINKNSNSIDWGKLFVSRFMRLAPLYFFLMFLFFLLVAYLSNGVLVESVPHLSIGVVKWLGFRLLGGPDLNGVKEITTTFTGPTWSLPYEWFFYLLLPIMAIMVGTTPPKPYIALGVISSVGLIIWNPGVRFFIPFLGGIIASFLVQSDLFRQFAITRIATIVIIICTCLPVILYPSGYGLQPLVIFSIAFALIASGNSLFGILTNSASRTLGEFAYSIYLLHSVILFVVFTFVIGLPASKTLSPMAHWLVVLGLTPILIFICFFTFRFIEQPAMLSTTPVTNWLRSHLTTRLKRSAIDSSH